jgi:hypothetical protein
VIIVDFDQGWEGIGVRWLGEYCWVIGFIDWEGGNCWVGNGVGVGSVVCCCIVCWSGCCGCVY